MKKEFIIKEISKEAAKDSNKIWLLAKNFDSTSLQSKKTVTKPVNSINVEEVNRAIEEIYNEAYFNVQAIKEAAIENEVDVEIPEFFLRAQAERRRRIQAERAKQAKRVKQAKRKNISTYAEIAFGCVATLIHKLF